jgi:hypothetical protein
MAQHHKYSITEIENMLPFERDLYVQMVKTHVEKIKERNNAK